MFGVAVIPGSILLHKETLLRAQASQLPRASGLARGVDARQRVSLYADSQAPLASLNRRPSFSLKPAQMSA